MKVSSLQVIGVICFVLAGCESSESTVVSPADAATTNTKAGKEWGPDSALATDGLSTAISLETCLEYARAFCGYYSRCQPAVMKEVFLGETQCVSIQSGNYCQKKFTSPGSQVSDSSLLACAKATITASCDQRKQGLVPECEFSGTKLNGENCVYPLQCNSGRCSDSSIEGCGICKERTQRGKACESWGNDCAPGTVCVDTDNQGGTICQPLREQGETCYVRSWCQHSLACIQGVCTNEKGVGDTCEKDSECGINPPQSCVRSYVNIPGICKPISFQEPGDSCNYSSGERCLAAALCKGTETAGGGTSVCVKYKNFGDSCQSHLECPYPTVCLEKKCSFDTEKIDRCSI